MSIPEAGLSAASSIPVEPQLTNVEDISTEISEERRGLRGALVIAGIAVSLLFLGWLFFYFVLFMRRGYVG